MLLYLLKLDKFTKQFNETVVSSFSFLDWELQDW